VGDGDRVLDVGCGNGQTTRAAAAVTPSGSALGVDLSAQMLDVARRLAAAEGLGNVTFEQGDAQVHPFDAGAFDLAVSRFGSMFFADKVAAFANIGRALRPGGRLLLVVWKGLDENEQFATLTGSLAAGRELPTPPPGAPSPFALADPELGRQVLEEAGFVDVGHEAVHRTFWLGPDADAALRFSQRTPMVQGLLADLDEPTRAEALGTLEAALRAHETPEGVAFASATWLISARRP
jgi:SAM-dependent methyltransferase